MHRRTGDLTLMAATALLATSLAATDPVPLPERGAISRSPATRWEQAFVSGNGRMGAMVFGDPRHETVIANHCRLYLPLGSRELVPDLAEHLPELRQIIRRDGYKAAMDFFLEKANEQGFPGLIWTDPFHPGFELKIDVGSGQRLDGQGDAWLALGDARVSKCGWQSAQDGRTVTGAPLRIGSTTFRRGIGSHAPCELVFDVGGHYRWLAFHTGISAEMTANGSSTVQVWLDGKLAHETPVLRIKEEPVFVCVPLEGVKEVKLVGTDAGDGIGADHVCFGNLRVTVSEEKPAPDDSPPETMQAESEYVRTQDFATGEVRVVERRDGQLIDRRLFVSRTHNAIVLSIRGEGPGGVSCDLRMAPIVHELVQSEMRHESGWITCHNTYVKGKGGWDGVVRVVPQGGKETVLPDRLRIDGADEVLVLMRIVPWKTPLPAGTSDAYAYSPKHPDFAPQRLGVYRPNPPLAESSVVAFRSAEDSRKLLPQVTEAVATLPTDYDTLFAPHAKAHRALFERMSVDLGGGEDRLRPTAELLDLAAEENRLPAALLEKMIDGGRYMLLCCAGERPPNLQGLWTGTWKPTWSGDFTTDTNIQLAVKAAYCGNLLELMEGYFRLIEDALPDWRLNARRYFGCRGVLAPTRMSNNGLMLHWGRWNGIWWTGGAGWLAHFFSLYADFTGDREFLANRVVPLLKEVVQFYEDFVLIDEATGRNEFIPSYSPESGDGINSTMDVMVCGEALRTLIAACRELGIDEDNIPRWQAMVDRMPAYRINGDGALAEWIPEGRGEAYKHRHLSHLHAAYEANGELDSEADPELWAAAQEATLRRIHSGGQVSTHGRMHMGLAAAHLRMAEEAYGRLLVIATGRSMYDSLICSHEPNQGILNTDGNGAIPEIFSRMLVAGQVGRLELLPALPSALPKGEVKGMLARGQLTIERLAWDVPKREADVTLVSGVEQTIEVSLPAIAGATVRHVSGEGELIAHPEGGWSLSLAPGRAVELRVEWGE